MRKICIVTDSRAVPDPFLASEFYLFYSILTPNAFIYARSARTSAKSHKI